MFHVLGPHATTDLGFPPMLELMCAYSQRVRRCCVPLPAQVLSLSPFLATSCMQGFCHDLSAFEREASKWRRTHLALLVLCC